jgi:two-component system NtrC family sensor kinase
VYGSASYVISRRGIRFDVPVILDAADTNIYFAMRLIALVYLGIGLYVLFRRWTAPHATHFYIFCLASFALYAFHYTGKLNAFDKSIYWIWIIAGALQPALFLHFALSFGSRSLRRRRLVFLATYLPAFAIVALQVYALLRWQATEVLAHRLDQVAMGYLDGFYILATVLFALQYSRAGREASQVLRRQQLKWLTRGALLSVVPFSALYVCLGHRALPPDGC